MGRCYNCGKFVLTKTFLREFRVCRYCGSEWRYIEQINPIGDVRIDTAYIDDNGYLRYLEGEHLVHRDLAFKHVKNETGHPFGECVVHHRDKNKLNAQPSNLEILTEERHAVEHGKIIIENGVKYYKFARTMKIRHRTARAYLIGRAWIPKSQSIEWNGYIYVKWWVLKEKGLR